MDKPHAEFLVLAFDIGTSSTRTALFDNHGQLLLKSSSAVKYSVTYGDDGRAELSPAILLQAAKRAYNQTLNAHRSPRTAKQLPIRATDASSFWHGLLGLDRKLRPLTPVFTWADSRAALDARRLREQHDERVIQQRTGCMLRSTFWPAKLLWLRRVQPKLFRRVAYWVSPSDWIFHQLFGELQTSPSMASATGLYAIRQRNWDGEIMDACGIEPANLPRVAGQLGTLPRSSTIVFCPIGDGAAGNLGSGCDRPHVAAINIGTSAAVRVIELRSKTKSNLPFGLFRYVVDHNRYVTGGAVSNAGNLRQWCLRELRLEKPEQALVRRDAAADLLTVLPFWVEERAPTWPEGLPGVLHGLNQSTTAAQISRAAATAVYYRLGQILVELENSFGHFRRIVVSGGILQSPASLKLLADAIGRDIEAATEQEASLRGAAVHALNQLGIQVERSRPRKAVKCNRALATKHRKRRKRQIRLEKILTLPANHPPPPGLRRDR